MGISMAVQDDPAASHAFVAVTVALTAGLALVVVRLLRSLRSENAPDAPPAPAPPGERFAAWR
jgi:hypothetical protein